MDPDFVPEGWLDPLPTPPKKKLKLSLAKKTECTSELSASKASRFATPVFVAANHCSSSLLLMISCSIIPNCALLCQTVLYYAKLCSIMPNCALLCQTVLYYAKLCSIMPNCALLCQTVLYFP